jgi:alpha-beta hydrolase superfamily lysophospholipase
VIVLHGRGEHGGVYERFGRRLATDAYTVHALDVSSEPDLAELGRAVAQITQDAVAPVVLAGSDTGALLALALVLGDTVTVDGVLLAGLLDTASGAEDSTAAGTAEFAETDESDAWASELAARTSCPTHRIRLTEDADFTRGGLADPVDPALVSALGQLQIETLRLPTLILHGGIDSVAPPQVARDLAARLPRAELGLVEGGRHDVLNDLMHRTVAAHVVQWLERLRGGADLAPIITVEPVGHLTVAG